MKFKERERERWREREREALATEFDGLPRPVPIRMQGPPAKILQNKTLTENTNKETTIP